MSKKCDLLNVSVVSGNNVSHSNRKTKRRFIPNLNKLSFKSDILGVKLNFKIAASTLRTINKYGNIDNFLTQFRFNKLTDEAKKYRSKLKKSLVKKEGQNKELAKA
jgi:large subunit ribosomal protein L28